MEKTRFEIAVENYINRNLSFKNLDNVSEEFYFGETNPLKTRLISDIQYIRDCAKIVYTKNRNASPKDVLPELKYAHERLKRTIIEEFNIEGCSIGWMNVANAACYTNTNNPEIYTNKSDAKELRVRLNDVIVSNSNGFKYRNGKGIYYCLCLGYDVFAVDNFFTVEEAAAILCHELGHCMEHFVNSINASVTISNFRHLIEDVEPELDMLNDEDKRVLKSHIKTVRKAIKSNDTLEIERIGKNYLDGMSEDTLYGNVDKPGYVEMRFSKLHDEDLDEPNGDSYSNLPDWDVNTPLGYQIQVDKSKHKKFNIFRFIFKSIKSLIGSIPGIISAIPSILSINSLMKDKNFDAHFYKVFEEAADNFCQIYGLGNQLASALLKLKRIDDSFSDKTKEDYIIQKIPLLDLWRSLDDIKEDMSACMNGYPVKKQRVVNLYKAAKYELANNRELSQEAKKELEKQIEFYKKIFNEYVYDDKTNKGWFYKIISGVNRDTIESVAKKDKFVEQHVLIPLQMKSEKMFNPEDAYK